MKTKFSIRYKFLAVTTLLLALCVGTYLLLASYIFKEDKRALVFDYNRSIVANLASEIETAFQSVIDKMQLVAHFHSNKDIRGARVIQDVLQQSGDIVWVGSTESFEDINAELYTQSDAVETYGLEKDYFKDRLPKSRPVPFGELRRSGEAYWNATDPNGGPALFGIAKSVIEENENGIPINQFGIIAYVKVDRVLKSVQASRPNVVMVMNSLGDVMVHADAKRMQAEQTSDQIVMDLVNRSTSSTQVFVYQRDGKKYFGASAKTKANKIIVFSSVEEDLAFGAVNDLVSRSLLFGSILVTLAFLMAILFSRSLTRPIDVLVGGMNKVSGGDLEIQISVDSGDEIASLAANFNRMILDLKASRAELEEINRELENKVRERTKQLEERNLAVKEAQEALLRSTRLAAVGEVAGMAAHEVLNPLTSMISRVSDLKDRVSAVKDNEAQFLVDLQTSWQSDFDAGGFNGLVKNWQEPSKLVPGGSLWDEDLKNLKSVGQGLRADFDTLIKDAEFLLQESHRISRIVNSFRSLSSVRADVRTLDINGVIDKSIEIMTDLASKHNISILKPSIAGEVFVSVDEDELIQVLTNLLRNSIQAINEKSEGQRQIRIEVTIEVETIFIRIHDTGIGISADDQKKLFVQKFTTKNKDEGTGIGLSLSRRLIRAFKGDIVLEKSDKSVGSTFVIKLPLVQMVKTGRSA